VLGPRRKAARSRRGGGPRLATMASAAARVWCGRARQRPGGNPREAAGLCRAAAAPWRAGPGEGTLRGHRRPLRRGGRRGREEGGADVRARAGSERKEGRGGSARGWAERAAASGPGKLAHVRAGLRRSRRPTRGKEGRVLGLGWPMRGRKRERGGPGGKGERGKEESGLLSWAAALFSSFLFFSTLKPL
jgi:hypothetical protein